jgi:hypothetical protein
MATVGSHPESLQESKAMTPCFLHTPNMTNKWNDFKPGDNVGGPCDQSLIESNIQERLMQEIPPLFVRSGQTGGGGNSDI